MIREALKLAALNALRGVVVKFVLPLAVVLVLVGGLIGGIVAAIFGGTGTAANAGSDDCTVSTTAGVQQVVTLYETFVPSNVR